VSAGDPFGLVGTTIDGKYRAERVVGEGGFGVVYAGTHLVLNQPVAVKVLKPQGGTVAEQTQLTDAFLREARVLFTLSHKAIVRFYEVGTIAVGLNTLPYVVLELLEGGTLEEEIARRAAAGGPHFTSDEIVRILGPVLEGLAVAHEAGVVHRDLKPANIMLVRAGGVLAPKILDFGTARAGPLHHSTTKVAFTPRYAAPEQWDATYGGTGAWTDVFAIGAILNEMCTLRTALPGDGIGQIMRSSITLQERLDIARTRPDLPPAFGPMLARAVAASPKDRFPTAVAMRAAFVEATSAGAPVPSRGPTPPPPPPAPPPWSGPTQQASGFYVSGRPPGPPIAPTFPLPPPTMPGFAHTQNPRKTNWTPWVIGAVALLVGLMVIARCSLPDLTAAKPPAPPPPAPTTGLQLLSVSDPDVRPAIKLDELTPCFGDARQTISLRARRENEELKVECFPAAQACTCAKDVVGQWKMTELKEGKNVSFSIIGSK
jgi:serine/threonine-protein kinase